MMKGIVALLTLVAFSQGRRFDYSNKEIFKNPKVIGGEVVEPNSIPYQLSIKNRGFHFCGGSIYDETTAITAAHCCVVINVDITTVVAGDHNQLFPSKNEQILKIKKEPFVFNDKVDKVKLPKQDQAFEGKAVVSGWGSRIEGFPGSFKLFKAELTLLDSKKCHQLFGIISMKTMICANGVDEMKGSCHGDSGGPLVCEGGVQCGLVSWGIRCGAPEYPGVYVKLSHFIDWIKEQL
ncbi:PRSS1_2_3 [Lepeophtheirus salmonis]|uniref:PRSS1_2_3 n=1 Tax=Lepeophtheirus salmonis TaxID=72036 RepID=A0A7R8CEH3_LEPSM|nr:PRSS1_2_3 [Lepeophtheirus salmonis]CAF2752709.1 PRSS1_2_3 [Lepeophtheirus salmonis]